MPKTINKLCIKLQFLIFRCLKNHQIIDVSIVKKSEIIIGSPRKNGNTFLLSQKLVDCIDKTRIETTYTFLADHKIYPCTDCRGCKKGKLICIKKDDMQPIYARFDNSDIIIIGTPIYWYGPTAQTKILIDRFRPYFGNKKLAGKKAALLLPAGDGEVDCDLTIEMFTRIFKTLGFNFLGAITAKAYDIGDLVDGTYSMESLVKLARKLEY